MLPLFWMILIVDLYNVAKPAAAVIRSGNFIATIVSAILYLVIFFIAERIHFHAVVWRVHWFCGNIDADMAQCLYQCFYGSHIFTSGSHYRGGRSGCTRRGHQEYLPLPFNLIGFIDDDNKKVGKIIQGLPVMGDCNDLLKIIDQEHITDLIFSISGEMHSETFSAILQAKENGVEVTTMPVLYEELIGRVPIFLLEDDWILRTFVDHTRSTSGYEALKRIVDIFVASVGFIMLATLAPLIALVIYLDDETGGLSAGRWGSMANRLPC